jgi:hypothetical protein
VPTSRLSNESFLHEYVDEDNRKSLIADIESDLKKSGDLDFKFSCFIFASTHKNDATVQKYAMKLSEKENFDIQYWGWDTIVSHLTNYPDLIRKYYPKYKIDPKVTLCSLEIWNRDDKVGFDFSSLLYGIDGTVSKALEDKDIPQDTEKLMSKKNKKNKLEELINKYVISTEEVEGEAGNDLWLH